MRRFIGVALAAVLFLAGSFPAHACAPDVVDLRGDWGQTRFKVELAVTPEEQARGLMFREKLGRFAGMLFPFETPRRAAFWMENTLIPLDILFIDETGRVARIHHEAVPLSRTSIDGGEGVSAVLEINGGMARRLGITEGSAARHPHFDGPEALWPCE